MLPGTVVSLVPSQTELLYWLGLEAEVAGITKFCVHPAAWQKSKAVIGGTKNIDSNKIHSLKPALIIANKEENVKEQVEELAADHPVFVTDVNNFEEALLMIKQLGALTGKDQQAVELTDAVIKNFSSITPVVHTTLKVCYLIWNNPYMTVGGDTFISDMLSKAGFENAFQQLNRYPQVSVDDIRNSGADIILLSSEPYPFKEKHKSELAQLLPAKKIIFTDGEMFSWYGSRMLLAPEYFLALHKQVNHLNS
ncbi:MAG: helical backbone metal receptor [Ferruginibacter sp.]